MSAFDRHLNLNANDMFTGTLLFAQHHVWFSTDTMHRLSMQFLGLKTGTTTSTKSFVASIICLWAIADARITEVKPR